MSELRSIQGLRLLALALAILTWYFVRVGDRGGATELVSFTNEYAIQYVLPETLVALESTQTVQLTIQGRESIVEKFNPFLVRVKVEIADAQTGVRQFELTNANVTLPTGLDVIAFEPNIVTVRLDAVKTAVKGVIAIPRGEPAAGAMVREITAKPALVTVRGPESELEKYDSVFTEPIDLDGHAIDFQERSLIVLPSPALSLPDGNRAVTVSVKLEIPGSETAPDDEDGRAGAAGGGSPKKAPTNPPPAGGSR